MARLLRTPVQLVTPYTLQYFPGTATLDGVDVDRTRLSWQLLTYAGVAGRIAYQPSRWEMTITAQILLDGKVNSNVQYSGEIPRGLNFELDQDLYVVHLTTRFNSDKVEFKVEGSTLAFDLRNQLVNPDTGSWYGGGVSITFPGFIGERIDLIGEDTTASVVNRTVWATLVDSGSSTFAASAAPAGSDLLEHTISQTWEVYDLPQSPNEPRNQIVSGFIVDQFGQQHRIVGYEPRPVTSALSRGEFPARTRAEVRTERTAIASAPRPGELVFAT